MLECSRSERPVRGRILRRPVRGIWWVRRGKGSSIWKVGGVQAGRGCGRGYRVWVERARGGVGYERQERYDGRRRRHGWDRDRGVDGRAVVFVERTRLRVPSGRRGTKARGGEQEEYRARFRRREVRRRAVFRVTDARRLYVSFEGVLLPMYRTMGVWGSRERKVRASYRLVRYTVRGSVLRLRGLRYRTKAIGTTDRRRRKRIGRGEVGEDGMRRIRWLGRFRTCGVKLPMVPVHVWLPEAHVEATTGGSVILAGVLLKVGTYGRMRRVRQRLPIETEYYKPRVYAFGVMGMLYTGRTAMRQADAKRVIAYASVSHMNRMRVGRLGRTEAGRMGAVRQIASHGVVSGGMFRAVGVRYDRYHTRIVGYYGGMGRAMPRYVTIRRRRTLGNLGLPGTSPFVGEWRILVGRAQSNYVVLVMGASGLVLGGAYSLWRYNRIAYGNRKRLYTGEVALGDRNCVEVRTRMPRTVRIRVVGIRPQQLIRVRQPSRRERLRTMGT